MNVQCPLSNKFCPTNFSAECIDKEIEKLEGKGVSSVFNFQNPKNKIFIFLRRFLEEGILRMDFL